MNRPLRDRNPTDPQRAARSSAAFFHGQCEHGDTTIERNKGIVANVLDARKDLGTAAAVQIEPDGRQLVVLRVASDDGGFVVPASTPSGSGDPLEPGDIVIWVPSIYSKEFGGHLQDKRCGWIGLIRAKIRPQSDSIDPSFDVLCRYA
jgi:hypothetical protein